MDATEDKSPVSRLRLRRLLLDASGRLLGEASGEARLIFGDGRVRQREAGRVVVGEWTCTFRQMLEWELDAAGRLSSVTCGGLRIPLARTAQGLIGDACCGADRYRAVIRGSGRGWLLAFLVDGPAKAYRSVTRYSATPQVPSRSRRTSSGSEVERTTRPKDAPWSSMTTPGPRP